MERSEVSLKDIACRISLEFFGTKAKDGGAAYDRNFVLLHGGFSCCLALHIAALYDDAVEGFSLLCVFS